MRIRSSACDYWVLNILFATLSCASLRAAPLVIPPDQDIGPNVTETFDGITVQNGGKLNISDSKIESTGKIFVLGTDSSFNMSRSNISAAVDIEVIFHSTFNMIGGSLSTPGGIFVDGSIFVDNPVGGIPFPPAPVMTITGGTVNAGGHILAQASILNISNGAVPTIVTTPELDAFIQGQININSGTIIATNAQDSVFAGAGSTINITGGDIHTTQLSVSGFNDGDVPDAVSSSINITGGKVTASDTAIVRFGGQLHIGGAGILNAQNDGVTIKSVGPLGPNFVT